ncbi:hypothetical protein A0H81_12634 [Grifola frondosa]|uniref:Uncharacterized protein n=1 Tax=Grifola frondosa TaxID=5627 RepID=A0A1C7LTT7_GRIFR|nr:hypothetical protein A0H81_12634 [Grifola frondosa]
MHQYALEPGLRHYTSHANRLRSSVDKTDLPTTSIEELVNELIFSNIIIGSQIEAKALTTGPLFCASSC